MWVRMVKKKGEERKSDTTQANYLIYISECIQIRRFRWATVPVRLEFLSVHEKHRSCVLLVQILGSMFICFCRRLLRLCTPSANLGRWEVDLLMRLIRTRFFFNLFFPFVTASWTKLGDSSLPLARQRSGLSLYFCVCTWIHGRIHFFSRFVNWECTILIDSYVDACSVKKM
jgi:hypothetical protein